jgi:hypothetical protein
MSKAKAYFENEDEILAAIDNARAMAKKALVSSEAEEAIAKTCYHQGPNFAYLGDTHKTSAQRWARKYVLLTEKTIPALTQKLAEMKTPMMFKEIDPAIPRRMRKAVRK